MTQRRSSVSAEVNPQLASHPGDRATPLKDLVYCPAPELIGILLRSTHRVHAPSPQPKPRDRHCTKAGGTQSGQAPIATGSEVDAAVAAAQKAFEGPWRDTTFEVRVAVLEKAREGIGCRVEEIAETMEAERGSVAAVARAGLIPPIMRMIDVAIDCARQVPIREVRRDSQGAVLVSQEPKGVVSAIVPSTDLFPSPYSSQAPRCSPGALFC